MEKKCNKCKQIKIFSEFSKDKSKSDNLQDKCKQCKREYYLKYKEKYQNNYKKNRNSRLEYQNNYYKENSKLRIKYQTDYIKNRIKNDTLFKLLTRFRSRTYNIFKNKKFIKQKTKELLGEDLKFIKQFIENKFIDDMSWDNYGKWHIDHIIPLSSAKTKKELIKLCHYTNLQPLWARDNLIKGCK